jgi:hypothetical protein
MEFTETPEIPAAEIGEAPVYGGPRTDRNIDLSDRHDPAPTPFVRPKFRQPTVADVVSALDTVKADLEGAIAEYQSQKETPDTRSADLNREIEKLSAILDALIQRRDAVEAEGTYAEKFEKIVRSCQQQTSGAAMSLVAALVNEKSLEIFGAPAHRISRHSRNDLALRYNYLERYNRSFISLANVQNPGERQLHSVCERIFAAIDDIKRAAAK